MPWTQRCAVAFLFGLGLVVTVAGAVRTYFIYRALFGKEYDNTWYSYPLWIAAAVEIDLGVVSVPIGHQHTLLTCSLDLRIRPSP
jgi:hypothetical protein